MRRRGIYWKEFRETRTILLLGIGLAVLLPAMMAGLFEPVDADPIAILLTLYFVWPVFAIVIASGLMAPEWSAGTGDFLFSLPAARSRLWLAKCLVGLASMAVIIAASMGALSLFGDVAPWSLPVGPAEDARLLQDVLPHVGAMLLLWFSVTLFASTVLSGAMSSLVAGTLGSIGITWALFYQVLRWRWPMAEAYSWSEASLIALLGIGFLSASLGVFSRAGLLSGRARYWSGAKWLGIAFAGCLVLQLPIFLRMIHVDWKDVVESRHGVTITPSPGGETLLLTGRAKGVSHIWRVNADGSGLRKLAGRWSEGAVWSPDGKKIAFRRGRMKLTFKRHRRWKDEYQLWTMSADGSSQRRLGPCHEWIGVEWSPDGQCIAWTEERRDAMFIAEADGDSGRRLLKGNVHVGWTPDSKEICLLYGRRLLMESRDGESVRTLVEDVGTNTENRGRVVGDRYVLVLREGQQLEKPLYNFPRLNPYGQVVWLLDRQTGDERLLEECDDFPEYGLSADERYVYFVSQQQNENHYLTVFSTSDGSRKQVGTVFGCTPSPGGRHLAFWRRATEKEWGPWVVAFDDIENPVLIPLPVGLGHGRRIPSLRWLTNEDLAFVDKGRLWRVRRDGTGLEEMIPSLTHDLNRIYLN